MPEADADERTIVADGDSKVFKVWSERWMNVFYTGPGRVAALLDTVSFLGPPAVESKTQPQYKKQRELGTQLTGLSP